MPDVADPLPRADPTPATDTLAAEQAYLADARAHLARMRERTLGLRIQGGDAVSAEYLAYTLHKRAQSLVDDPTTALFFGRTRPRRRRALVHRTPARRRRRRRPGRRRLAAPTSPAPSTGPRRPSRWASCCDAGSASSRGRHHRLRGRAPHRPDARPRPQRRSSPREIERPARRPDARHRRHHPARAGRDRPQPTLDHDASACRARPGTGKTAVGLHRAAYLLYAHRDQLARSGVLVVGPNRAFLELHRRRAARASARSRSGTPRSRTRRGEAARTARTRRPAGPRRTTRPTGRAPAQGRRPDGAGAAPRRSGRTCGAPTRRSSLPRGVAQAGGCRRTRSREIVAELRAPRRALRAPPATCSPSASRTPSSCRWRRAGDSPDDRVQDAVAPQPRGQVATSTRCGPRSTRRGRAVPPARRTPAFLAACADGRPRRRRAGGCCCGTKPPAVTDGGPVVARPTSCCSTSSPTCSTARRASATSCSTRRRTSPRCSCARSDAGARRGRRPCSATSRRARRRGRRRRGRRRWRHLGKPDAHVEVLDRGLPRAGRRHRRSPPACCRSIAPGAGAADVGARRPRQPRPGRCRRGRPGGDVVRCRRKALVERGVGRPHRARRAGSPRPRAR